MFNRSDVESLFGSTGGVGGGIGGTGGVPSGLVNPGKRVERYRPGQLPSYAPAPPPPRAQVAPLLQPSHYELPTPLVSVAALAPPPPPPPPPPPAPAPRVRVEATVVSTSGGGPAVPPAPMPPGLPGLSGEEDAMARRARIRERMLARSDNSSNPASSSSSSAPGEGAEGAGSRVGSGSGGGEALTALALGGDSAVRLSGPLGVAQPPPEGRHEEEAPIAPRHHQQQQQQPTFRPVFVPRAERGAVVKSAEEVEVEAAASEAAAAEVAASRIAASRLLLAEQLAREEAEALAGSGEGEGEDPSTGRPDDTDRPEEEAEALAAWRVREVKRVVRDAEAGAALAREMEETARRRGLTDEERAREDALAEARGEGGDKRGGGGDIPSGPVVRFHHRGAFFMDSVGGEGDVRSRSTLEATDGEKSSLTYNRALLQSLPAAARVKAHLVGRRGQGRYTSLMDEDTTQRRR